MSVSGRVLCFTGTLQAVRADATRLAVSAGASVTKSVTKKTEVLVCGDGVGATKLQAARAKGVEIWTEDEFNAAVVAALASGSGGKAKAKGKKKPAAKAKAKKAAPATRKRRAAAAAAAASSDGEDDEGDDDDEDDAAAAAPARKTRAKTRKAPTRKTAKPAAKKSRPTGLGGVAAPVLDPAASAAAAAAVDSGLAVKDARLASHASVFGEYNCKLAQVVKRSNTDKYYIMQIVVDGGRGGYYVWSRWGRTGTSGSGQLTGPHDEPDDAVEQFAKTYKTKTGYEWDARKVGGKAKSGKYAHLVTSTAGARGQWQYYTTSDPLGKPDGWYDYDDQANDNTEGLYHDMQNNPSMTTRYVFAESNGFTYAVDLVAGTQTNTSSRTSRPIRRVAAGGGGGAAAAVPAAAPAAGPAPAPAKGRKLTKAQLAKKAAASAARAALTQVAARVQAGAAARAAASADVDKYAPPDLKAGEVHDVFDAMLNQTNIVGANNNKFIKTQVIKTGPFKFYHWKRWGRVGDRGQSKKDGPFDEDGAVSSFVKYFKSKTGNNWDDRDNFVNKPKKYLYVEIEHDADKAQAQAAANGALVSDDEDDDDDAGGVAASTLDAATQSLVALLFNEDVFKSAMVKLNIDPRKLPLGALSQRQLDKGEAALQALEDAIKAGKGHATLGQLTGVFYATIPHSFGRAAGPVITDLTTVMSKYDMINTLRDIDTAQQMAKDGKKAKRAKKKAGGAAKVEHPLDLKYRQLNTDLTLVQPSDGDFEVVTDYLQATSVDPSGGYLAAGGHNKLRHVWRVNRHGEAARFAAHDGMGNRHLLWHGTNVAVVAAIFKSGLRIMPHSGGRVGRGIYLADCQAKSANYCQASYAGGRRRALMFLVEAPLGKEHFVTQDGHHASSLQRPPPGHDSVVALGKHSPDGRWNGDDTNAEIELDGHDVKVPQTKLKATGVNSTFHHNEILVYREDQARIRYVLEFDW